MTERARLTQHPTKVVNIRRDRFDVYCGRPGNGEDGTFGNPYQVNKPTAARYLDYFNVPHVGRVPTSKAEAVELYVDYLRRRLDEDKKFEILVTALRSFSSTENRGLILGCFCPPSPICHGIVLARLIDFGIVEPL